MDRIMTVSRDGHWAVRVALVAVAALLWVMTYGAVSASADPPDDTRGAEVSSHDDDDGEGGGPGLPGSVRWR